MKNILILLALILSIGVSYGVSQPKTGLVNNEVRAVKSTQTQATSLCCCDPNDVEVSIQGQVITGGSWKTQFTRVMVAQFDGNQTLVSQRLVVPNAFGYYHAVVQPCYDTFLVPQVIKAPSNMAFIWNPGSAYIWMPQAGNTYTYNFMLTDVYTY